MEFSLLFAAGTGVAFLGLAIRLNPRLSETVDDPFGTLLGAAVVGLGTGRLASMLLSGTNPVTHAADILLVRGGVDTGWATLGALATLLWMGRRRLLASLDALAAPALFALGGWHLGCLWRSACLGTATSLPWGVTASGSDVSRHPTEVYTGLFFLAAAIFVSRAWARGMKRAGVLAGLALAAAAVIRLVTEPSRLALGSGATSWYVAGSIIGFVSAIGFLWKSRQRPAPD